MHLACGLLRCGNCSCNGMVFVPLLSPCGSSPFVVVVVVVVVVVSLSLLFSLLLLLLLLFGVVVVVVALSGCVVRVVVVTDVVIGFSDAEWTPLPTASTHYPRLLPRLVHQVARQDEDTMLLARDTPELLNTHNLVQRRRVG